MQHRNELLRLLIQHEELLDDILGDWQDKLVSFELKKDAKPYHHRSVPIPPVHRDTVEREVERLVGKGVLKTIQESE